MSVIAAVATATPLVSASPLATATPSVSPSVAPSVAPVVASSPSAVNVVFDYVNHLVSVIPTHEIVLAAAVTVILLQLAFNKFKFLDTKSELWVKVYNWLLSFALPAALTGLAAIIANGQVAKYGPVVYLVAQFLYFVGKTIVDKVTTPKVTPVTEF